MALLIIFINIALLTAGISFVEWQYWCVLSLTFCIYLVGYKTGKNHTHVEKNSNKAVED